MNKPKLKAEYLGVKISEEKPRDGFFILEYEGDNTLHYVTGAQLRHLGELMVALANMERLGL